MQNDWFRLFTSFWWLIFPLSWMVMGMMAIWSRHMRANRLVDLIKHYADQGKEPPPELLATLQKSYERPGQGWQGRNYGDAGNWGMGVRSYGYRGPWGWVSVFLFAGLAAGFVFMAWNIQGDLGLAAIAHGGDMHVRNRVGGLIFVAFIMGGLAIGNLVAMLASRRDDRNLPDDKAK